MSHACRRILVSLTIPTPIGTKQIGMTKRSRLAVTSMAWSRKCHRGVRLEGVLSYAMASSLGLRVNRRMTESGSATAMGGMGRFRMGSSSLAMTTQRTKGELPMRMEAVSCFILRAMRRRLWDEGIFKVVLLLLHACWLCCEFGLQGRRLAWGGRLGKGFLLVCSAVIIDAHGKPRAMRLCFLKARACATDGLCMMTGAKHRVRSTRGARGSNPSQKTPRQRGAIAPSTHEREARSA